MVGTGECEAFTCAHHEGLFASKFAAELYLPMQVPAVSGVQTSRPV